MPDYTKMTNEEYFRYIGTLSKERIEELLDLESSVDSLKTKFEDISIDTFQLVKVIEEMEEDLFDSEYIDKLNDYESYVFEHSKKLKEFYNALDEI